MDLSSSSDEEGLITDVSWDEEFTRRLFGDLMKEIISDGKIIILNDSDKEDEEVCEEKTISTEDTATSVVVKPASTASINTDDAPLGMKNDNSDDRILDQEVAETEKNYCTKI
jgi:hypothetical protein